MPSGFDPTTTPANFALDVGVLSYISTGTTRTPIGVTRGGTSFKSGTKVRQPDYDGRRHMYAGGDRVIGYESSFDGTFLEFNAAMILALNPQATLVSAGTPAVGTYTPVPSGTIIVKGSLLKQPRLTLTKSGTATSNVFWEFDYGYVEDYTVTTKDKEEAEIKITILARVDPLATGYTTDMADFRFGTTA